MEYPKVLVVSHNPFSDSQNNGKTLSSFFEGWPKEKIAQIYLTPDIPDDTVCERFYRITDLEVLKKFIKNGKCGDEIKKENFKVNQKEILHKSKLYILIRNLFLKRLPIMYCIRNIVWQKVKPWKEPQLDKWIDGFGPDIVFFQSSNVHSIFDMVDYIVNKYNTKLYMETTDDYVTKHFTVDPFYFIDINKMIKKYSKLVKKSQCVFAIGDMMAEEYIKRFNGNFKVAMNSVDIENEVIPYKNVENKEIVLTYAGNLGLNRWKILHKIGKSLDVLYKEQNIKSILNIYSIDMPSKKILKKLNLNNTMCFKGKLNKEELINVRNQSDILVHVESFDRKNKYITRLSVSTKIPEYLLSQRAILAVGPEEVASIKYIKDNKIGKVINTINEKELKDNLKEIITDRLQRYEYIIYGNEVVQKNHSFELNRNKVQQELMQYKT